MKKANQYLHISKATSVKKVIQHICACFFLGLVLLSSLAAQAGVNVTYYHNDLLGSPVAATDETGALKWQQRYAPYGEQLETVANNSVGYTGHQFDSNTGLTYAGARYYDQELGRFISIDPVGALGSAEPNPMMFNRYAYGNNNPYKFVDPDGNSAVTAFGGLIYESAQFLTGNGFDGTNILGALADGYNGEGDGFASAVFEDVTSFVPAGVVLEALAKASRLAKVTKSTDIKVLGRLEDTKVARDWDGYDVLNIKDWTIKKNDQWVEQGIKNKQEF